MEKRLVCVRDAKTEVFGAPVLVHNLAHAERLFSDLVSDSSSDVGKHPEDYDLFCVGTYDETTGIVTPVQPILVKHGSEERKEAKHE